jgi:hypothetical protein|tara:strand:- start:109 stop:561 length:453 start_codon:yes stop_codon:yes gene_type:complete
VTKIPNSALILGLAGLIPFFWGAATSLGFGLENSELNWLNEEYKGSSINSTYGTVILAFMSGVLWGFAANVSDKRRPIGLILSVLPALWAFFTLNGVLSNPFMGLIIGFLGVFVIDVRFYYWRMVPEWWLSFRSILTLFVIICLSINLGW